MRADENGVFLGKEELACLLEFSAKGDSAGDLASVRFKVEPKAYTLTAYSNDGARAVAVEESAVEEGAPKGEWLVRAGFLRNVLKLLAPKGEALLRFSGASLTEAGIFSGPNEMGERCELPGVTAVEDECIHQSTILGADVLDDLCRAPIGTRAIRCGEVHLHGSYLASLEKLSKATEGALLTMHVGEHEAAPVKFVAENGTATWVAVIMPTRPRDPGLAGDEGGKKGRRSDPRHGDFFAEGEDAA